MRRIKGKLTDTALPRTPSGVRIDAVPLATYGAVDWTTPQLLVVALGSCGPLPSWADRESRDERRRIPTPTDWRVGEPCDYAARRSYRWCRPPTCGLATTGPHVGGAIGRGCGESLSSDRCVRDWW